MPAYEVTAPDGKVYEVNAPDGATEEQVLAYAKEQFSKPAQESGMLDKVKGMLANSSGAPIAGGPLGMIAREGMKKVGEATDRMAYGAGGAVTDALAGHVPPEVAGGAGYVANVGTNLGTSYLIGKLGSSVGKPTMESAARRTMHAALKPPVKALESGKATRAIDTLLKEDVGVNQAGVAKLRAEISNLEDEIEKAISGSNAMVNKAEVGKRLKDALEKFRYDVNPNASTEAIRKSWLEFRNHPLLAGKTEMPVQLAQKMKRATYKTLDDAAYGEMKGAEVEARKALARGLKEEVAKGVPQVSALNARQSDLVNAAKLAQRRSLVAGNNNVLGLSPIAPNAASMLAFLADRSPTAASYLARLMYQNAGVIPGGAANAIALPMLLQSGTAPALLSEQGGY